MINPKITVVEISKFMGITPQGAHQQIKTREIKYYRTGNVNYLKHEEAKQFFNFKIKPTVIAFELVKGGVGKTSLSFHCAVRASLYGLKCAMIDLDQQANLTRAFGINENDNPIMIDIIEGKLSLKDNLIKVSSGIDLLPSKFENAMLNTYLLINNLSLEEIFKQHIEPLKEIYDLIFIDCPPDLGSAVTATVMASDLIIAPIEPDRFSISGLDLTLNEINKISHQCNKNIPVKIVLNKFNPKTNLSHQTLSNLFSNEKTKNLLFKSFISLSQDFPNSFNECLSLFDTVGKSTAKNDIDLLTREILEMVRIK